jgi:hypothetical protein
LVATLSHKGIDIELVYDVMSPNNRGSWAMNATVRENIIFRFKYDSMFYERRPTWPLPYVLDHFAQLLDGDETVYWRASLNRHVSDL